MKKRVIKIIISLILFVIALVVPFKNEWIKNAIYIISYIIVGFGIIKKAIRNIFRGKVFDENFLMTVATLGAFIIGEFPEAVGVMLFYQVGELFQDYAVDKSRKSISNLMDIRPDYANLKKDGKEEKVDPDEVKIGDIIVIKPGEKVPLDGIVIEGKSMLDVSALTGESIPRQIEKNGEILSGSINIDGVIEVKVTKEFKDTEINEIIELVKNSNENKSKTEKFITKFARVYTPIVVLFALILAFAMPCFTGWENINEWIRRALVFLVTSCPCALVLSIPLGYFAGIRKSRERRSTS